MIGKRDRTIIRDLASEAAAVAALPDQEKTRRLWRRLNALDPVRPMVMIDQVCWHELEVDKDLALACGDPDCRAWEQKLRRQLYQWKHFRVDMVVESTLDVPMAVRNSGFGIEVREETAVTDPKNDVVGHRYMNQLQSVDDLAMLHEPRIEHDAGETERRLSVAHELFDGLLTVRPWGMDPYLSLWDPISTWMGVENALYAIMDRPEFMHALARTMTDGYLSLLDQLEEKGLLCGPQSLIHCTGAWTTELPAEGFAPARPRTRDIWMFGLAQMFATVSPAMFREFEVDYTRRICERFGLVYYGCCDPLDRKMNEVRMIPHVRKISMSPWADQERGAAEIGKDYVFSRKPSPALLAGSTFHLDRVREDLTATKAICEKSGSPLEIILKDISTVGYEPQRLFQWARTAMEIVQS
jgi:hypothetical protein